MLYPASSAKKVSEHYYLRYLLAKVGVCSLYNNLVFKRNNYSSILLKNKCNAMTFFRVGSQIKINARPNKFCRVENLTQSPLVNRILLMAISEEYSA